MRNTNSLTFKITFMAVYAALIYGLQVALASLPNIELVTLMLSIAGLCLPRKMSLTIALVFVLLEGLTYGFGDWMILYFVAWPALTFVCSLFKKLAVHAFVLIVIIDALFGFLFGSIDAIIKLALYDSSTMLAYWIKGLLFDMVHGTFNFLNALLCFKPVYAIIDRYCKWYIPEKNNSQFDFKVLGFKFQVTKFL